MEFSKLIPELNVSDIESYYGLLKKRNVVFFKNLMIIHYDVDNQEFSDKEFLILDPDGYLLRFNE